jgi:hypothetical protein
MLLYKSNKKTREDHMTNVVQFKWTPPADQDGYRAASVHEAVWDAAVAIDDYAEHCNTEEFEAAQKVMKHGREDAAGALMARELQTLYAAANRMWGEVVPEIGRKLKEGLDRHKAVTGRHLSPAELQVWLENNVVQPRSSKQSGSCNGDPLTC